MFITDIQTKATIFNDFFVLQGSPISTGSTIPAFFPPKVFSLVRSLDSNKAHALDGISAHMITLCYFSIVEPLCIIFDKIKI